MKFSRCIVGLLFAGTIMACQNDLKPKQGGEDLKQGIVIDIDFPGGNIIVDDVETISTQYYSLTGNRVSVRPDFRDTGGQWFYWFFRVSGAADQSMHFDFPEGKIGSFGPAFSNDGGKSWQWLYEKIHESQNSFQYSFGPNENEVFFSMGIPYLQEDFSEFISSYENNPFVEVNSLTLSAKGRNVEQVFISHPEKEIKHKVIITARHHSCEAMANYVIEGLIASVLDENLESMKWLRDNVEFLIIPFMDKDGVEDGDQGKNRKPKDHAQDYLGESIYKTTAALREKVPVWSGGQLKLALDLHCPGLTGDVHTQFFAVGVSDEKKAKAQKEFIDILLKRQKGELRINPDRAILEYGTSWNVEDTTGRQLSVKGSREWFSEIENVKMASVLEIPYANIDGQMVTQQNARLLGKDIADAISIYLQEK